MSGSGYYSIVASTDRQKPFLKSASGARVSIKSLYSVFLEKLWTIYALGMSSSSISNSVRMGSLASSSRDAFSSEFPRQSPIISKPMSCCRQWDSRWSSSEEKEN